MMMFEKIVAGAWGCPFFISACVILYGFVYNSIDAMKFGIVGVFVAGSTLTAIIKE